MQPHYDFIWLRKSRCRLLKLELVGFLLDFNIHVGSTRVELKNHTEYIDLCVELLSWLLPKQGRPDAVCRTQSQQLLHTGFPAYISSGHYAALELPPWKTTPS